MPRTVGGESFILRYIVMCAVFRFLDFFCSNFGMGGVAGSRGSSEALDSEVIGC